MASGVIIDPDEGTFLYYRDQAMLICEQLFVTETHQVHLILDMSRDPIILPSVTPAEHFRVIVHPLASGQSYNSYLLECMDAFRTHRVFGITGMATHSEANGIDYCVRIVDELISNEDAICIVSSGWVFGPGQYALDIVLVHQSTTREELVPGSSHNWNFDSQCKLQRCDLPAWIQ